MKHISPSLVAVAAFVFLIAAMVVADESSDDDRERPSRGPQLPPPLRIFDEDGDNALSPEEINKLTERLSQLDQDGDGRVDPRELEGFFGTRRPPRRGDDRFDREDRDDQFDRRPNEGRRRGPPGRGDDRFERDDFDDDFDERGRPPSQEQRRSDNDNRPRGEAGTGTDRLIERLYRYDANGDGKLSADELPARAKRLIEQADRDQDGSLDRKELEIFLSSR